MAASIPCAPIHDVAEALTDPHTRARGLVIETTHPALGRVRTVASPVRVGNEPRSYERAPLRGEHSQALLRDLLGYDEVRLEALEREKVFGDADRTERIEPEAAAR
jgi:crotonobetainyl-CoA:carnitine CoA-transferase CaiB-like acyl-CoA transferase